MNPAIGAVAAMKSDGRVSTKRTKKATFSASAKCDWIRGSAGATAPVTITMNMLANRSVIFRIRLSGLRLFILASQAIWFVPA
jgi:hypothetical protein